MKLKVGKKYVLKHKGDIEYIAIVDYIDGDEFPYKGRIFRNGGLSTRCIAWNHMGHHSSGNPGDSLVAEYTEPQGTGSVFKQRYCGGWHDPVIIEDGKATLIPICQCDSRVLACQGCQCGFAEWNKKQMAQAGKSRVE